MSQGSCGQHGTHLGPAGPRWAPCWPMNSGIRDMYRHTHIAGFVGWHVDSKRFGLIGPPSRSIMLLQNVISKYNATVSTTTAHNNGYMDISNAHIQNEQPILKFSFLLRKTQSPHIEEYFETANCATVKLKIRKSSI